MSDNREDRRQQRPERPPRGMMVKPQKGTFKPIIRVMKYVLMEYKFQFLIVILCIVAAALATLTMTLFTRTLIDTYILPMIGEATPDFSPLAQRLLRLAAIMGVGVLCNFGMNRILVSVSQGSLKRLRVELFDKMESLPLKYFDTRAATS